MRCLSIITVLLCTEPGQVQSINWETAESCQAPWTGQKNLGTWDQWTPSRDSEATKDHPAAWKRAWPLHQWDQLLDAEGNCPSLSFKLADVHLGGLCFLTPFFTSAGPTKSEWSWSEREGAIWLEEEGLRGGVQAHAAGEPAGVCSEGEEPVQQEPHWGSGTARVAIFTVWLYPAQFVTKSLLTAAILLFTSALIYVPVEFSSPCYIKY